MYLMSDARTQFRHLGRRTQLRIYSLALQGQSHPDKAIRSISQEWASTILKIKKSTLAVIAVLSICVLASLFFLHIWSVYSRGAVAGFLLIGGITITQQHYLAKKILAAQSPPTDQPPMNQQPNGSKHKNTPG